MESDIPLEPRPFSIFKSAAEEATIKIDNKRKVAAGRKKSAASRVVHVPGGALPYHVVATPALGLVVQHTFATMREAETFIRRNSAASEPRLSTLYDRPAPKP